MYKLSNRWTDHEDYTIPDCISQDKQHQEHKLFLRCKFDIVYSVAQMHASLRDKFYSRR